MIVVGGGPAGSSTAFFLASAGARVCVLDRARFPRDKPCSEYLSPEASRILDRMDAEREILQAGAATLRGMRVRAPNGAVMFGEFAGRHGYRGFREAGLAIRRTVLDAILLRRACAAGAQVHEGWKVSSLDHDAPHGQSRVSGSDDSGAGFTLSARIVVGADGLNSGIAARAGLSYRHRWPRRLALVTHYDNVAGLSDVGEMHVQAGGYLGIAPVDTGLANVALVVPARASGIRGDPHGFLASWIERHSHLAQRFRGARQVGRVAAVGPFARRAPRTWAPGIALVGDAADFFDPFTGEGMYTALRGGEMLASHVLRYCADQNDAHLAAYHAEREREFAAKNRVERIVGAVVSSPALMNRLTSTLARKKDMADLLVGVTGDFVPAREVLRLRYILGLLT